MHSSIEVVSTGVVYRNPKPYLRSIVAYHPSLVLLGDAQFLVTFDIGQAVESLDYHTVAARSRDSGATWDLEGPLLVGPPPETSHSVRVCQVADGTLVGFGASFQRNNPEEGLLNRQTSGFVPTDLILVRSRDGGRTWETPHLITPPLVGPCWEICHPIVELHDGRWLAPVGTWRDWNGASTDGEQTVALLSDDQGQTWPRFGRIFDGRKTGHSHLEVSVIQLRSGHLLAVSWVHDMSNGRNFPTEYSLSDSRGERFTDSMLTGFHAQTCKVIELQNGLLFCAFRDNERPGLWSRVARLDGQQWTNLSEAVLWQGADTGMRGRTGSAEELGKLKFGYPSLQQLAGGDILLVFWCQEECVTGIRWIRVRVQGS